MVELNPCRNPAARHRADCCLAMTETFPGRKPVWAILIRVFLAAALALPAFGASAGVVLTSLHSFQVFTNGANPFAGLVQGNDGNFYGTTDRGDFGTVFRISATGALTTLYSFHSAKDGGGPQAGLVQGSDGNFYGTTDGGGVGGAGTVFRLSVVAPVAPAFQAVTLTNSTLSLTWTTEAGNVYQLQYNSDLASTNWINLGSALTATGTALTFADSISNGPQRFYRLVLLP